MKNITIEIKWGILFSVMSLLWMMLEKAVGLHDEYIDKHAVYTNLVAIPAILLYFIALADKRKNHLMGFITFRQGFISGLFITLVVTILAPLTQWITFAWITPDYFNNVTRYVVEQGKMSQADAEAYFSMKNYIIQGLLFTPVMGIITSLIAALVMQKKKKMK
jgi:hypothetical protein